MKCETFPTVEEPFGWITGSGPMIAGPLTHPRLSS